MVDAEFNRPSKLAVRSQVFKNQLFTTLVTIVIITTSLLPNLNGKFVKKYILNFIKNK